MPNWCSNYVTISGPDVEKFRQDINKWHELSEVEKEYDPNISTDWLGRLLYNSGLVKYKINTRKDQNGKETHDIELDFVPGDEISCRAFCSELPIPDIDGDRFTLMYDSAWSPMINIWRRLADFKNYDVDITFTSEEPGCEIYVSNDDDVVGLYMVDACLPNGEEYMEQLTEKETISAFQNAFKTEENDFGKLTAMANNFNDNDLDYYIYVHEYEYADLCDVS